MDLRGSLITLSEQELDRIGGKIWNDFIGARSNHDARILRFRRYIRLWRGLAMGQGNVDDGESFEMPTLIWTVFAQWARVMQAILGDDAEIVAAAKSPVAMKTAPKVGRYLTWRFFEYMKAQPQLSAWVFRCILNGRSHAYCPYEYDYFMEMQVNPKTRKPTGELIEKCYYDGPRLTSLYPSEIILPVQDGAMGIDDFSFTIRRSRMTPQELLDGESRGQYDGVTENWNEINALSKQRQDRNFWYDDEKIDVDQAEGTNHSALLGARDSVEVWQWYSTWRMPNSKRDSSPKNLKYRALNTSEVVVSFLPDMRKVIGVQDLRQIYPRMRKRRPFLDMALVLDGSYWCPGFGELIEKIQYKQTANYALGERAGKFSVGPLIFYRPGAGFDPDKFEYDPNKAIPCEDPKAVNVVSMTANLGFTIQNQQLLDSFVERLCGVSDQTLGRSIDRPNAPQTATGQVALLEQGNVRAALDMTMIREALSVALEYIWLLDREFSSESVFFRATEDDAQGMYDVKDDFGTMTTAEREHPFDFQLKFATSVWSREASKQKLMQVAPLLLQNPLILNNPAALWNLLSKLWDAFGEGDFSEIIPKPPEPDQPKDPKSEWAMALEGMDVDVNPNDDDNAHIIRHKKDVLREEQADPADRDDRAIKEMLAHIVAHEQQIRQKMLLQALAQRVAQEMQQRQQQQGQPAAPAPPNGIQPPPPGAAPPQLGPGAPPTPAINTPKTAIAQGQAPALGGPPPQGATQ